MAKLIASYDTSSREGYAGLGSKELARIFYVARHLKHLSLQVDTLPALNCEVDCWWANERPKEQQLALEQQLDQLPRCSIKTSDDHFFIITGEALLSKIEKVLKETDNSRALYMTNNMLV